MDKALKEAIKQFFRVVVLAVIPVLVSMLSNNTFDWRVVAVTGAIAGLMFIDKFLHETGKAIEKESTTKNPVESALTSGLTRF